MEVTKVGRQMRCSNCKEYGHNKKSCKKKPSQTSQLLNQPSIHKKPNAKTQSQTNAVTQPLIHKRKDRVENSQRKRAANSRYIKRKDVVPRSGPWQLNPSQSSATTGL